MLFIGLIDSGPALMAKLLGLLQFLLRFGSTASLS